MLPLVYNQFGYWDQCKNDKRGGENNIVEPEGDVVDLSQL